MNLLPFVMMIVVVLALFSGTLFQNGKNQLLESHLYKSHFSTLRKAQDTKSEHLFEEAKERYKKDHAGASASSSSKGKSEGKGKKSNDEDSSTYYFRSKRIGWEKGRFQLHFLLEDRKNREAYFEVAANYLYALYGHASFYPKEEGASLAAELLKALLKAIEEWDRKEPPSFQEIKLKEERLQKLFQRMVRGTYSYDIEEKKGIPPFHHFFSMDPHPGTALNFHYANIPFLITLFGEEKALAFIKEEKEALKEAESRCRCPFRKQALQEKLQQHIDPQRLTLFDMNYSSSKKKPAYHSDPDTGVVVRLP